MAWCLQCGVKHELNVAVGQDEDGEPACRMHAIKSDVKSAVQPEKSKAMETKLCPGVLGKPCQKEIGARAEVCGACYARRLYHQNKKRGGKTKATKSPAAQPRKAAKADGSPASYGPGAIDLGALKAKLLAQLAAIELVEKIAVEAS